jgi:hypothetical protein
VANYVVIRSELIETRQEAVDYYAARIAGRRVLSCHGKEVAILFPGDGAHLFSEEADGTDSIPKEDAIVRRVSGGRTETRRFSLERARLLDEVDKAITHFTVSIPGTGPNGYEKRMLHGRRLPDGQYLRVPLRPGPDRDWTCVSAYPVEERVWRECCRAKRAKFPPDDS